MRNQKQLLKTIRAMQDRLACLRAENRMLRQMFETPTMTALLKWREHRDGRKRNASEANRSRASLNDRWVRWNDWERQFLKSVTSQLKDPKLDLSGEADHSDTSALGEEYEVRILTRAERRAMERAKENHVARIMKGGYNEWKDITDTEHTQEIISRLKGRATIQGMDEQDVHPCRH